MNCLIISLIVVILVLTFVSYTAYLSPHFVNLNFQFITNLIGITAGGEFYSVTDISALYLYMENFLAATMYNSDKGDNPFRSNFEMIGGIQLRILRSPLYQCTEYVSDFQKYSCFDIVYNSATANKTTHIGIPYNTSAELGIHQFPSGNLTTYTDGGFIVEFNRDLTAEAFIEKINYLREN